MAGEQGLGLEWSRGIARKIWREAGELAKAGEGGEDHPDLVRALAQSGVPVARFRGGRISRELRWHPRALYEHVRGTREACAYVEQLAGREALDKLIDEMASSNSPAEMTHQGKRLCLYFDESNETSLEVRVPALVARIRSPAPRETQKSLCHGVAVVPFEHTLSVDRMRIWGDTANARACWISQQFFRGVLVLTPNLLDAIAIHACSELATWWVPKQYGVTTPAAENVDPVPHDYYVSRQVTRVIIAHPIVQRPEFFGDGMGWLMRLRQEQPALKVDFVTPTPLYFPTLVKDAPESTVQDKYVRYVPTDEVRGNATWMDALRAGGVDMVRKAIFDPIQLSPRSDPVVETPFETRAVLSGGPIEWSRRFLFDKFLQDGDRRWRLARVMGSWWVMTDRGWEQRSDEKMRHAAVSWLLTKAVKNDRDLAEPLRPRTEQINQFMLGLSIEATSPALQIPCWLPETIEYRGEEPVPRWSVGDDVLVPSRDPNTGKPLPEWLLTAENGILNMQELREGRVDLRPHDPCYFGGPSLPYSIDPDALQRLLDAIPRAEYGSDEWLAGQDRLIELCKEHAPVFISSLCELLSDYGPFHLADRLACLRAYLGDAISWSRVWEKVPLIIGKQRSGKDLLQFGIQAANGQDSIVIVNNFDEMTTEFAYAPFVGKKIAIIPDGQYDYTKDRGADAKIKQMSGRGYVRVRDLYTSAIPNVRLSTRLWIVMNNAASMRDPSMALPSRLLVFPCTETFVGREDDSRKDRVMREGQGIGHISLLGFAEAWMRKPKPGLFSPKIAEELEYLKRMFYSAAPLKEFVEKFCRVDRAAGPTTIRTLWLAYRGAVAKAKLDVEKPISRHRFGDEITHHCHLYPDGMEGDERLFRGIDLNDAGHRMVQDGEDAIAHRRETAAKSSPPSRTFWPATGDKDDDDQPPLDQVNTDNLPI